jgi:hypothetical protein
MSKAAGAVASAKYEIKLNDLADASHREFLRNVFYDPEKLKPTKTRDCRAAERGYELASSDVDRHLIRR